MAIADSIMWMTEGMTAAENRHAARLARTAYRRLHARGHSLAYRMWLFARAHERAAKENDNG